MDGFAKVRVNGGARNRLQTLQLPRGRNVVPLNRMYLLGKSCTFSYQNNEVGNRQREHHDREDRRGDDDDDQRREYLEDALSEELDVVRKEEVDRLNVLADAVQNATERSGVEEAHWRAEDRMEQRCVEVATRSNAAEQKRRHSEEHEDD